ncbi:MAG: GNAT family N-acetyltransferase [Victivallaceae bacterium]|nr:GNAT family N-acetyltransferase [Victivallaceae bacterium]
MKLKVINEAEITPELDFEIKKALCRCFPDDAEIFSRSRAWHGSVPAWSVILFDDSHIAAHTGIIDRTVEVGETCLRVAGIQNVFVPSEYRGRGLCEKVMSAAMEEAERRNFDAGLLYCVPKLERVYAKCGWWLLAEREVVRIDENENQVPLPAKNITMFFPLKVRTFPDGNINLRGNDW